MRSSMTLQQPWILPLAAALLLSAHGGPAKGQSFPCVAAQMADEAIICQNQNLIQLDLSLAKLYADLSEKLAGPDKRAIAGDQKEWLLSRHRCGMDKSCIQHSYERRMSELSENRSRSGKPLKILFGSHAGDATILSLTGADTDRAVAVFRRELDDWVEYCARNIGAKDDGSVDALKISDCIKDSMREENGRMYKRRAMCSKSTVYTEFGNYSMINSEKEAESAADGKTYRPIRTDWKNHRNEEIVGNCSACGTPQLLSTFKVLCPASYAAYFEGYDPY